MTVDKVKAKKKKSKKETKKKEKAVGDRLFSSEKGK
jgi:hypothetical protein